MKNNTPAEQAARYVDFALSANVSLDVVARKCKKIRLSKAECLDLAKTTPFCFDEIFYCFGEKFDKCT